MDCILFLILKLSMSLIRSSERRKKNYILFMGALFLPIRVSIPAAISFPDSTPLRSLFPFTSSTIRPSRQIPSSMALSYQSIERDETPKKVIGIFIPLIQKTKEPLETSIHLDLISLVPSFFPLDPDTDFSSCLRNSIPDLLYDLHKAISDAIPDICSALFYLFPGVIIHQFDNVPGFFPHGPASIMLHLRVSLHSCMWMSVQLRK